MVNEVKHLDGICKDQSVVAGGPLVYQIQISGQLGPQWADWFEGLTITLDGCGGTLLTGPVADQAALYGLLRKVRDLGIPLLAVNHVRPGQ